MNQNINFTSILPVLFYEYLAISITKSLIPIMFIDAFGKYSYQMIGVMEMVKGILAFLACPLFGKISDIIGRKYCLLVTVIGSCLPYVIMGFTDNMWVYAVATSLSGGFSATFVLTFAYISDVVPQKERAPAYGLALATFGLSFCVGPVSGGYIASLFGNQAVFRLSGILLVIDILYIVFVLKESCAHAIEEAELYERQTNHSQAQFTTSMSNFNSKVEAMRHMVKTIPKHIPDGYDVMAPFRLFRKDEFMVNLAIIVFMYYTAVWAVVSTLMVYVTRRMHFDAITVGYVLTLYGLATMVSESVLVRIIVPKLGETNSMRLGLLAFSLQCVVIAFARNLTELYFSILFSMFSNLVYPSISSLLSRVIEAPSSTSSQYSKYSENLLGEALGTLNGIKALTEGFGPLIFGMLMSSFEDFPSPMEGAPYLIAAMLALWGLFHCYELPDDEGSELSVQQITSVLYSVFIRKKSVKANNDYCLGEGLGKDKGGTHVKDDYYTLDTGVLDGACDADGRDDRIEMQYSEQELKQKRSSKLNKFHDEQLFGLNYQKSTRSRSDVTGTGIAVGESDSRSVYDILHEDRLEEKESLL